MFTLDLGKDYLQKKKASVAKGLIDYNYTMIFYHSTLATLDTSACLLESYHMCCYGNLYYVSNQYRKMTATCSVL